MYARASMLELDSEEAHQKNTLVCLFILLKVIFDQIIEKCSLKSFFRKY